MRLLGYRRCAWMGALLLLGSCAATRPEDVPTAAPATFAIADDGRWPGAVKILQGLQLDGERTLRPGDGLLYGLEIAHGEQVTRKLLRIDVHRPSPDVGRERGFEFYVDRGKSVWYYERSVELEFVLYDERGNEEQRSRTEPTHDRVLEASFLDGIRAARAGDTSADAESLHRLVDIVNLLNKDPILKRLLSEVATVPLDLRLLFRRRLRLWAELAAATPVAVTAQDPFGGALGECFALPFDLTLNDSVFARLSATVTEPRGPLGVAAGIVLLRAQQATDPTRQVRLQLLAGVRGPQSEWQKHGVLASCGNDDAGLGLAFSPDGRWVAMPGLRGEVELRDLHAGDPSCVVPLRGEDNPVGDLAFLDATTLLVGRGARVEVFSVAGAAAVKKLRPVAAVVTQRTVLALEMAPSRTCFVGLPAGEVERWTFGDDLAKPEREAVRAPVVTQARIGNAPPQPFYEFPPLGFLVAGDDRDRVVVRAGDRDVAYQRRDGVWRAQSPQPIVPGASRGQRWRQSGAESAVPRLDAFGKGGGTVTNGAGTWSAFGGERIQFTRLGEPATTDRPEANGHGPDDEIVHGFDPSGRFYAFVAPGLRLLFDVTRFAGLFTRTSTPDAAR